MMNKEIDLKALNEKYEGKSLKDFLTPFEPLDFTKNISKPLTHSQLRKITDAWQMEEITYSRMLEMINEHFGFDKNRIYESSK